MLARSKSDDARFANVLTKCSLAYAEMRLILAKLLWNFDVELCEESKNWATEQKVFILWEKGPLMVRLKKVSR